MRTLIFIAALACTISLSAQTTEPKDVEVLEMTKKKGPKNFKLMGEDLIGDNSDYKSIDAIPEDLIKKIQKTTSKHGGATAFVDINRFWKTGKLYYYYGNYKN